MYNKITTVITITIITSHEYNIPKKLKHYHKSKINLSYMN